MRKPTLTFVAVITVATIVIGYLYLQLRAERKAASQLREHVVQLEREMQTGGSALTASSTADQAPPPTAPGAFVAPATAPVPDANGSTTRPRALFSPEIQKELGLTQEESAEFIRLLRSGSQEDLVALIGPARYEQYQELQRTAARGQQVDRFRTSLADSDHPLTDAQAAQLDTLLAAEQRRRAADEKARVKPTDPRALLDYDEATLKAVQAASESMIEDARRFLSEQQVAILQSQLDSTVTQRLTNLRIRRAQLDAGGR